MVATNGLRQLRPEDTKYLEEAIARLLNAMPFVLPDLIQFFLTEINNSTASDMYPLLHPPSSSFLLLPSSSFLVPPPSSFLLFPPSSFFLPLSSLATFLLPPPPLCPP
jgi:hypothetical protein